MCEVVRGQQAGRKFDSQTEQPSSIPSCKVNKNLEIKTDNVDVIAWLIQVKHGQYSRQKDKPDINARNSQWIQWCFQELGDLRHI